MSCCPHRSRHHRVVCAEQSSTYVSETCSQLAIRAKVSELLIANGAVSMIGPNQPYDGNVIFDGGEHRARIHDEAAIATHGHYGPVGCGEFRAQRTCNAESHRGKAPGLDEGPR